MSASDGNIQMDPSGGEKEEEDGGAIPTGNAFSF